MSELGFPSSFDASFPGLDADNALRGCPCVNTPEFFGIYPGDPDYETFDEVYPQSGTAYSQVGERGAFGENPTERF